MKNRRRLATNCVCCVGAGILASGISTEAAAQVNDSHEVRVLPPGNAAFDEILRKTPSKVSVPQIAESSRLQGALLMNESAQAIVAFSVHWRVLHQDGSVSESYQSLASEPEGGGVITGVRALLAAGERAFVTPGVHWTKDLGQVSLVANFPSSALPGDAVSAELDSAVFADGKVSGPNKSTLLERIFAERRGQFDESGFISQLLSEGRSDDYIRQMLESHIQRGREVSDESRRDWYVAARGRQALRMALVLENQGRSDLQKFTSRVELTRANIEEKGRKL